MINRNCTCSREPLMALNLHQSWTGGLEEEVTALHYPLNNAVHLYILPHTHTHTHIYIYVTRRSPGLSSRHVIFHSLAPFHFISNALHRRPFHSALTPCDAKPWLRHTIPTQFTFQPLNSISSPAMARVSAVIITTV